MEGDVLDCKTGLLAHKATVDNCVTTEYIPFELEPG